MTLDSLRETNVMQLEHYLDSDPYREYLMHRPYYPKRLRTFKPSYCSWIDQQSSFVAYQELLDNRNDSIAIDRLAYKLRMKSDLNIDTLRETRVRQPRHRRHHYSQSNQSSRFTSDLDMPSNPIAETMSTNSCAQHVTSTDVPNKSLTTDDLDGIAGNPLPVRTLNDLIKQCYRSEQRLTRRPAVGHDNASTQMSSDMSNNDRTNTNKTHQGRPKQPQALTEYRFNAPTFRCLTSKQGNRDPTVHQGLIYQYRTRSRIDQADLVESSQRSLLTPEQHRPLLHSPAVHEVQAMPVNVKDKRIQEQRDKCRTKIEKQVCVCNKLTIADPFSGTLERLDSNSSRHDANEQHQHVPSVSYFFPPVRPLAHFTRKSSSTIDDVQQQQQQLNTSLPSLTRKHRHQTKPNYTTLINMLPADGSEEILLHDDDNASGLNETAPSLASLV
jgi:hypothetical protein